MLPMAAAGACVLLAPVLALATPEDADFLPLRVGTRWSYIASDGHEVAETVRGIVDIKAPDGSSVGEAAAVDAADGGEYYLVRTETGVVRFYDAPSSSPDAHATWILRFPLHLGSHWESWTPAGQVEFRVTGRESIPGPDGQLTDGVRIDFSSLPEPIFTGHFIYARGVGPMEIQEGDYTRKLLGYRPGDGAVVPAAATLTGLEPPSVKETWRVGKKGWFALALTIAMAMTMAVLPRIKRKPSFRAWEENERELLEEDGDLAVQAARLESSVASHPGYADLRCKLGTVYLVMARYEDAVQQFRAALEKNHHYVEAALGLSRSLLKLGLHADAVGAIAPMAEKHPTYADVQNVLGEALAAKGDTAAAEEAFRRALAINPNFGIARQNLDALTANAAAAGKEGPGDAAS